MTASIRPAVASDAERLAEITRCAYAKWVPVIGREPLPMGFDQTRVIADDRVAVIELDGRVVGLAHLVVEAERVLLENLAVDPAFAGRGLGRRLLAHAEAVTAAEGMARLALYTNAAFDENLRFYRKAGFDEDRREPFRGGFTVHMSKSVVPSGAAGLNR